MTRPQLPTFSSSIPARTRWDLNSTIPPIYFFAGLAVQLYHRRNAQHLDSVLRQRRWYGRSWRYQQRSGSCHCDPGARHHGHVGRRSCRFGFPDPPQEVVFSRFGPQQRAAAFGRAAFSSCIIHAMSDSPLTRRSLFRTATGAAAISASSYNRILGANNRVQLGLIGCGGRGKYVMETFTKTDQVEVPAVCDVWPERSQEASRSRQRADVYRSPQAAGMKQLDAVSHRHARSLARRLRPSMRLNAGKDVYVEKPLTLKIEEGPQIVKAARINNRVCQVGMQQRSGKHYLQAKDEIHGSRQARQDHAGADLVARQRRTTCARSPEHYQTKPSNLDWARYPRSGEVARLGSAAVLATGAPTWISAAARSRICSRTGSTSCTCSWGRTIPIAAIGVGRRLSLQGRPHGARHDQRAAGIPRTIDGDVRGDAGARHHRRSRRMVRDRGPL